MLCKGFHCYQEQGWWPLWLVVANMGKTSIFPRFFIGLGMPPLIPKMDVFQVFGWKLHALQRFPLLPRTGMVAFVVGGSKYGENNHFSMVFHRFVHAPTDPKNGCFPVFWMETSCFARMSIVTKNMDGALVVVAGSKYGENIHFSKVFHKFGHAPTDPKNGCFPIF